MKKEGIFAKLLGPYFTDITFCQRFVCEVRSPQELKYDLCWSPVAGGEGSRGWRKAFNIVLVGTRSARVKCLPGVS